LIERYDDGPDSSRPAGDATIVTLEALNLEADALTASHSFASRRASRRL
jgi:hypothetical protein